LEKYASPYRKIDSVFTLVNQDIPEDSIVGIVLAILSLIIMPVLVFYKLKAANHLESRSLLAEAKETLAD
jgi:divalent metal cation (Fe/Co/Zn/Cd) transporter